MPVVLPDVVAVASAIGKEGEVVWAVGCCVVVSAGVVMDDNNEKMEVVAGVIPALVSLGDNDDLDPRRPLFDEPIYI